ncbi:saccharopine dehydrogenase family protein [Vibrio metschnikovii]|uniref:carboxynorspermidine synthase n=1 Tax=unclassified Vibrio TaxID=2614977 RepID=UPI0013731D02|nr:MULTISPECIES: carboxynorspermidine synthase [unclassified Vibrio]EKO3606289.1 saccharopine dehydrogenase family protein [Vibrio metschnikovii]EKO3609678.1 saccharopine dehydrogenase family protein [Vibrio metschnikovii]EKO3639988.1 saccharopine dehydrogenase family protein [Vibrio metschnikovii]EKO3682480.1 saccharopine dehydrogenase family protein [Vibrio metschnikovii]EKO3720894.1 saccharopine dehydrogenase family protein [Vibrio metschnikovii]
MSILQIGAGGVGWVVAHKAAQNNDVLGDITIASRSIGKCEKIIESIKGKNNLKDSTKKLEARAVDADDVAALVALINEVKPDLVINAGPPWVNVTIMEACYQAKVSYLDTSVAVDLCTEGQQVPEAYDPQWAFRDKFKQAGITGILSAGFDPGVVSVFAAYAVKHLFDEIDTIDVLDINAGDHGKKFATNFDPETNLLEIQGDSFYWEEGQWKSVPCHTRMLEFDFPNCGNFKVYSMSHDEIRSLQEYIPAKRIEFWMGFGDRYLNYFNVMKDIGLLNPEPLTLHDGTVVKPLQVLKAMLPDPTSLAPGYTGLTCIGTWVQGRKDGKERSVFIYNNADHQVAYKDVEHQAIAYTTGVPAITAALQFFRGEWAQAGVFNMEQLNPDPFLETMPSIGLDWDVIELEPGQPDIKILK